MIEEIKKAMAICEKYNVSIFRRGENPLTQKNEVTVEMYDSDTFFAMASDYYRFGGGPYCENWGVNCDTAYFDCECCKYKEVYRQYIKRADGVWFYCAVPENDEFEAEQRKLME